jgi:hypothetical protein
MFKTRALPASFLGFGHWVIGNWNLFRICSLVLGIFSLIFFLLGSPEKASPPHVAGGVFFLGGGYDYIKGGEMERLINVRIFILAGFGFFSRGAIFLVVAAVLVIGDIPAFALELERTQ